MYFKYLFEISFQLLGSLSAAGLHKRHLMVWKIFAPRFVFEGASFILVGITSLLVYLIVIRIDRMLEIWVQKLMKSKDS